MKAIPLKNVALAVFLLLGIFFISVSRSRDVSLNSKTGTTMNAASDISKLGSFGAGLKLIQVNRNQQGC